MDEVIRKMNASHSASVSIATISTILQKTYVDPSTLTTGTE